MGLTERQLEDVVYENTKVYGSGFGMVIGCMLCGSARELTREEAEYSRYFGTIASIYICDECKMAIQWAKDQMTK